MRFHEARSTTTTVRFGPSGSKDEAGLEFELDLRRLELRHQGRPVNLRPQPIQALAVLLRNAGRLVSTEELRRELWGDQHLEWRNSLHQCMRDLRRALSDDPREPRFVTTVARRGYRFVGEGIPSTRQPPRRASRGWGRLGGSFRRPSLAFVAGFVTAVLLPVSFFVVCAVLAG